MAASGPLFPELHDDWPVLRDALDALGVEATTAVWSDPSVEWASFDLVLANGTWGNIHEVEAFLSWVDRLEAAGVAVRNSPATLRWNIDKRYLRDLQAAGVPTVPTIWVEPSSPDTADVLPGGEVVVKPSISGGGYRTARYGAGEHEAVRAHIAALTADGRTAMVQPYEARVDTDGETALVFVAGRFTHALHKGPMIRRGTGPLDSLMDNLVIAGGTATPAQRDVATGALHVAEDLLGPTTYARVDLVARADGTPAVLELELLDPVLFFTKHRDGPDAAKALAEVLAAATRRARA